MQNHLSLHRSFDIQLSPVAASIIDWAPKGEMCGVVSHAANAAPSSSRSSGTLSRGHKEQPEETRRRCRLPNINSHGSMDSGCAGPSTRGEAITGNQWLTRSHKQEEQPQEETETSFLRRTQGGMLVNSFAAVPLFKRGTFSVNGGFFACLGMAPEVNTHKAMAAPFFGPSLQRFFYASDIMQLECFWGRMQWCALLNVVCYTWRSKSGPLCEVVGITPYTDWTMQADHLLFSWSGFWRMYVRRGRESRPLSHISLDFPSSVSPPSSSSTTESEVSSPVKHVSETKVATPAAPASHTAEASKHIPNHEQETPGGTLAKENPTGRASSNLTMKHMADTESSEDGLSRTKNPYRWWRVEELRGGIGIAAKNDLVSGVNVYCGCSLHTARALTMSAHVDALRRACCSVTSTTDSFDFAARLRLNLITWHRTELDTGFGWRPLRRMPGLTCRVSHSMGRTSVGVTLLDVAHMCTTFSQTEEVIALREKGQPHVPASGLAGSPSSALRESWYDSYSGWVSRAGGSIVSSVLPISMLKGNPEENRLPEVAPNLCQRLSRAVTAGFHWVNSTIHHAKFDLTLGATANQPISKGVRFFVVVSAR